MNSFQLAVLNKREIVFDPAAAAASLNRSCRRMRVPRHAVCCCDPGSSCIFIPLEDLPAGHFPGTYVFSRFPGSSAEDVSAELQARYVHEIRCIGSFCFEGSLWGLFERP